MSDIMLFMTTKKCPQCGKEKDLESFIKPSQWRCKDCENQWLREYRKRKRETYLLANPKPIRDKNSKACKICSAIKPIEEFNYANRAKGIRSSYCKKCQSKLGNAQRATRGRVQSKCSRLSTTVAWYYAQQEKQRGMCALCGLQETHETKKGSGVIRALSIDHDHETGKVRELLCFRCNTSLFQLELHGVGWAYRAVEYLKKHKERHDRDISA
jgi:hypothetical protein